MACFSWQNPMASQGLSRVFMTSTPALPTIPTKHMNHVMLGSIIAGLVIGVVSVYLALQPKPVSMINNYPMADRMDVRGLYPSNQ